MQTHHPATPVVTPPDRIARLVKGCVILLLTAVVIFSRTIAVPALAAVLISIALFPIVNRAARIGIPRGLAALLALLILIAASTGVLYGVRTPLGELVARAPDLVSAGHKLLVDHAVPKSRPVTNRQSAVVQEVVTRQSEQEAMVKMMAPVAAGLTASLIAIGTSLILSYFILTCGTGVGRAALAAVRERSDRRTWLRVCGSIRTQAAGYLQLVTVINIVFGVATGLCMSLLGVENAPAYGAIAGLMNFIPIVGAWITAGVLVAGGLAEEGMNLAILVPPAVFLLLHLLESQFVTPQLLGRRLLLNPLIVIAGVMVGATAWGVGGAFLAVPILTSVKIAFDGHPGFRRWGQVLGRGALLDSDEHESRRRRLRRGVAHRAATAREGVKPATS
jgi:predicted PurR-regulated permease PerM